MISQEIRRVHSMGHGRTSQPVLWGFEGKELLIVAAGFAVAIGLFRFLYGQLAFSVLMALVVSLIPLGATIAWVTLMVSGKPKAYAVEFFEWHLMRLQIGFHTAFFEPARHHHTHPFLSR